MFQVMIQAVRDAIRLSERELAAATDQPVTDIEEYLLTLGTLQGELKMEYDRRRFKGEAMAPCEILSGDRRFRKL